MTVTTVGTSGLLKRGRCGADGSAYPSVVQIELTSFCNAVCFFCAHTWSSRPQHHMSARVYKKIIDEIRSWHPPVDWLYLTGLGEPMMHPQWKELYSYTKGLPGAFTTNCSVLKEEDLDFLFSLGFSEIAFSLDTLNDDRHRKIRGFGVDRVFPKIEAALEIGRGRNENPRLIISTTLTYETVQDMREMHDWIVPRIEGVHNALWHIKQIGHFPDIKAPIQIMPPMNFIRNLSLPTHPQVAVIREEDSLRPYCTLWFDRITILSDGSPVPCCHQAHDRHGIGNASDSTLLGMFNSKRWKSYQQKFALREEPGGWDEIPYCKDCH